MMILPAFTKDRIKAWFNRTFRKDRINLELKSMNWKPGQLDILLQTSFAPVITAELVKFFKSQHGVNNVSMNFFDASDMQQYQVIIQKRGRPDITEINGKMTEALLRIYDEPENAGVIASKVLLELGYHDH